MPDVRLDTLDLRLARTKGGVRGFQFLHALDEPGDPGRVGTIVFDQLHHGLGAELSLQADRYRPNQPLPPIAYIPGMVMSAGPTTGPLLDAGASAVTPFVHNLITAPSSFNDGNDVFLVLAREVIRVPLGTGTWVSVRDVTGTTGISGGIGPVVRYDGEWWAGLFDGVGLAIAHMHSVDGITWTLETAGTDKEANFFLPVHGGMFAVQVTTAASSSRAEWKLSFTDANAAGAILDANWVDIVTLRNHPVPTGMAAVGRYVLIFGADGSIVAVADAPPVKTLMEGPSPVLNDRDFGTNNLFWGSDLMATSNRSGLLALNLDRLAGREVNPASIQGFLGRRRFRPFTISPMGPDLLVGTRGITDDEASILLLRRYPEGVFYNQIRDVSATIGSGLPSGQAVMAMEYLNLTGILTFLVGGTVGSQFGRIGYVRMPFLDGSAPTSFAASAVLETSHTYGPFPGRKLALQVRGFYPEATTNATEISVIPDMGAAVSAGAVTAAAPFALSGARVVGSTFALQLDLPAGVGSEWPRLLLPLMLDYIEEPRAGDRIRLIIEVPTGQRRRDAGGDAVENALNSLRALRNSSSTVTLTLHDVAGTPSSFTVLVEKVDANESTLAAHPYREYPEAVAVIDLRVV